MKRAAIFTVFVLLLAPRALAAPSGATVGDTVFSMRMCAERLRDIPEKDKSFKTPKPCENAAAPKVTRNADGALIPIDNSWILADINVIRSAFKEKCVPCRMSRGAERKKKKSEKEEDRDDKDAREVCDVCADGLAEFKTLREALSGLAGAIELSAESAKLKPVSPAALAADKVRLKKILAKEEYQKQKEEVKKPDEDREWEWYKNLKNWLKKRLSKYRPKPSAPTTHFVPGVSPKTAIDIFRAAVAVALILALALGAAMIALKFKRLLADEAVETEEEGGAEEPSANVKAMLSEAETLRRSGEFRLAIRSLFLAFLRLLEQKELVVFIKNKTNREYLRELKKKKQVGPEIEKMNLLFEESWYGMKDCGESEYAEFLKVYEESKREV